MAGTCAALFILLFYTSCSNNRLKIDTSDIDVKLDIRHFEADLFENKLQNRAEWQGKYPYFLMDYTKGILGFPGTEEEAFNQLMLYRTDVNAGKMYKLVKEKFGNFSPWEQELTEAYRHFKYYFPSEPIPAIITYTGNFSFYLNPVGQDYIGIALDMHMGSDFKPYTYAGIENYWQKILVPENIVSMHMMAHANDLFSGSNRGRNFTDDMVYYGKLLYFLDAMCPELPDHLKIGMSKTEYDWCVAEEHNIWTLLVKEKYLFETDRRRYERLLKEGPKTIAPGVPTDAPAMLGRFAGWMAVRKYMQENKVELPDLMRNGDAEKILQASGYRP